MSGLFLICLFPFVNLYLGICFLWETGKKEFKNLVFIPLFFLTQVVIKLCNDYVVKNNTKKNKKIKR